MNDKRIINTISTIYFIITSFLLFIFLTLLVVFVVLQNGLFIENISTPNLKVKQLYIKWNESLDISIKEVAIEKNENDTQSKIDLKKISRELSRLSNYYNILEKVSIDKISYKNFNASFKYTRGEDGYLNVVSPDFVLQSSLYFESNLLNIQVDKLIDDKRNTTMNGNIILDIDAHTASTNIQMNIHNDVDINIFSFINEENVFYKVKSNKEIKNISYLIKLANLHPGVTYWADEAIQFSSVSLKSLYGWVDFENLDNAYKNIYAHAIGKNLKYKYNQYLDDIHTQTTDVIFKDGSLNIYPRQAHTYKSKLGKSWITIDFTKKEELLSIKLLFDGQLDKDTLGILEQYKIKVPFLQNSGSTNVDLTINVNLRTIGVSAQGKFFTKKANFRYLDHDIDIFDTHIKLTNYDVKINKMLAKYKDIVTSKVNVSYDAKIAKGDINFDIEKIAFKNLGLYLDTKESPLKAKYQIAPNRDKIYVESSQWLFKNKVLNVENIAIPFNLKKLLLNIPSTLVTLPNIAQVNVHGLVDLNTMIYDLKLKPTDIYLENIYLTKPKLPELKIHYDDKLTLSTDERIDFQVKSINSFINKSSIEIKDNILNMEETYINIGEVVKTKFSVTYSLKENKGEIKTNRLRVKTQNLGTLYLESHDTNFDISQSDEGLSVSSKDLDISFLYNDLDWRLDLNSLERLERNSKLLQKYNITKGKASIFKAKNKDDIQIGARVYSSNQVMVKNNIPLSKYIVRGKVAANTNVISLNVNENVDVTIDKNVDVKITNIGVNMNALADIVNAKQGDLKNYSSTNVTLNAKNTYLYISPSRHALSENINLTYSNKILKATLQHKKGIAHLQFKNGFFHVKGGKFNDRFMENLFSLSKFKDGNFKFTMSGTPNKYDGLFTIDNTTLLDYKLLNNILAFVNTVPALVTFSAPSYSTTGLKIKTAYMKFTSTNDLFNISDISLDSKELDIVGNGTASFVDNDIDLKLNLKTDLGSSVSKVPLVGHLLLGKDSISTTLHVSGALNNPDVSSLIARDIAVAPLNILLRAVTLPLYLLNSLDKNSTQEKK